MTEEAPKPKPRLGAGDVQIMLCDAQGDNPEPITLKPSYHAARTLSGLSGGLMGALERVTKLDVDAVVQIISLGMGSTPTRRPPKDLGERVYATGLTDDTGALAERCVTYLRVLMNGGQMPQDGGEGGDEGDPPKS